MKKYIVGYTQGTFDMFHIGHLNLLENAREKCETLIVGINSDALVERYKNKTPVINATDRARIVRALRCVDDVIICDTLKKTDVWSQVHFDAIFIGDDWRGNKRWEKTEEDLKPLGVDVVYLTHTDGISSSLLRTKEDKKIEED